MEGNLLTLPTVTMDGCFDSLELPMDPEIIELSLPGKVGRSVIVVRVHADRAPRPVLMVGSAPVRLHGRNAVADRNRVRQLCDESLMPSRFSVPLLAPTLDSVDPDCPKTVVILRSGVLLPVGDVVAWRALSEQATQVLGQALDNSPITEAVGAWCAELGLPTPGPSRLAGHHRARWLRLVRSALADWHLVDVVTGRSFARSGATTASSWRPTRSTRCWGMPSPKHDRSLRETNLQRG